MDDLQGQIDDMLANSVKRRANKEKEEADGDAAENGEKPPEEKPAEGDGDGN